jgi:Short C-terminal domain/Phospholipase_D-nuclease N-terminal
MTAYDYPILGAFWTMMIFFLWFAWIMLLFRVIADIIRARGMGGAAKAFWLIFVIAVPWLGVLIYLLSHGGDMAQRGLEDQQAQQEAFTSYVREAAGTSGGSADELAKLADLRDRGVISDAEFASLKGKLLA